MHILIFYFAFKRKLVLCLFILCEFGLVLLPLTFQFIFSSYLWNNHQKNPCLELLRSTVDWTRGQVKKQNLFSMYWKMKVYKLELIFSVFFVVLCTGDFLAVVPTWKATTRYSAIIIGIGSDNKLFIRLFCIFPLPVSKSLMSRWENNLRLWGLLAPSGTLKYPYANIPGVASTTSK